MHIPQLLYPLLLRANVEVIKPLLPGPLRRDCKQLALVLFPSQAIQHPPRKSDLQRLHHLRQRLLVRLAHQQVKVLRHHDISEDDESIPLPHRLQHLQKQIASPPRSQPGPSPVTTAGYEVQVLPAIMPLQTLGHVSRLLVPSRAPSPLSWDSPRDTRIPIMRRWEIPSTAFRLFDNPRHVPHVCYRLSNLRPTSQQLQNIATHRHNLNGIYILAITTMQSIFCADYIA